MECDIQKWRKRRSGNQLRLFWDIVDEIRTDPNSEAYGMSKGLVAEGIKFQAVDYGFPTEEVPVGKGQTKKVPMSISDGSNVNTANMSILIEVALMIGGQLGADVEQYKEEYEEFKDGHQVRDTTSH
jgi:hypothetical protein